MTLNDTVPVYINLNLSTNDLIKVINELGLKTLVMSYKSLNIVKDLADKCTSFKNVIVVEKEYEFTQEHEENVT